MDIVVGLIIIAIITASICKIYFEKKKGVKCIGCPHSGTNNKSSCNCDETYKVYLD